MVTFSNGFKIAHGHYLGTSAITGNCTITFSVTFNSTDYSFIQSLAHNTNGQSSNANGYEVPSNRTTSSVCIHFSSGLKGYEWVCLGY